ncbi:hypothetical protein QTP70_018655 [Hemibagrus guttatus]|uniref:Transmembrane channel-like protein n=1 Tax=Hemibagrus guttatus TaxID=175788 RepID=A0AAE0Q660_9TELE|nr:hypothetical protein QTP70_018655 [Hemibagrus guttatus]
MPREKLITLESEADINDSVYYVGIDVDGRQQREEMDKKKIERKVVKKQVPRLQRKSTYLYNDKKNRINGEGEVEKIPKERKNSKTKKVGIQQDEAERGREERKMKTMQGNDRQSKKKGNEKKKTTDSISDVSSTSSSDDEFVVDLLSEEELEKLIEAIEEKKKLIATLKTQHWPMNKKLSTLRESQAFIEKYEGTLGKVKGRKLYACKVMVMKKWVKFQRNFNNFKKACIPWEMKIKEIESHFGSSVASYFILLRWMFGINIILFALSFGLVIFPEALMGMPYGSIPRKTVPRDELSTAMNFDVLWDIEGYLKYSVLFYGYYNNQRTIGWIKFRMPLCYLLVAVVSVAYSYIEVIRITNFIPDRLRPGLTMTAIGAVDLQDVGGNWATVGRRSRGGRRVRRQREKRKRVAEKYVRVVQDMYERSRTVVRCAVGQTEEFKVEVGLHQGLALSPFLFATVMDQLSEEVSQESPWTMMFSDDIVICSENREEENLESMARNESQESGGDETHFNYSWKIFTSWDYLVGNPETADSKFASIATTFKETIIDEKELKQEENIRRTLLFRILANIMIFTILVGSGYLIYFVVRRSEKFIRAGMHKFNWWERNEVNAVMSLLTTFCPMYFEAIALIENYHPRIALRWQLGRVFALYVGNLYSFVIAVIEQINISRVEEEEMKYNLTMWEANMYNRSIAENSTFHVNPADVPRGPCWETMVGQEFVRMVISDTLTVFIVLLVNDFFRAVVIRLLNHCWCWDLEYTFPCYSFFDLSGNVLGLIFNQGMIWMGTLFAPCLPALNLIKLQSSMYIQAWGVLCCNIPHTRIYKASRSSNFYMNILLFILFVSTLPTIFTIVSMRPSFDCGPFSGKDHMYDVITESLVLDFPRWLGNVFSYISNPGLVVPFLLLMVLMYCLTIYYLHTTSKSYKQANNDLKKKLRAQCEENRMKSRVEAKKSAEYLEQVKKVKQSNNNASEKVRDNSKRSRQSYFSPPPNVSSGGRGPSIKYSHKPPYTRPPAPRSHLLHGQLPGFPPY